MVIQYQTDLITFRILLLKHFQKGNKIGILMCFAYQMECLSSQEIDSCQQGQCSKPFVFIVPHGYTIFR